MHSIRCVHTHTVVVCSFLLYQCRCMTSCRWVQRLLPLFEMTFFCDGCCMCDVCEMWPRLLAKNSSAPCKYPHHSWSHEQGQTVSKHRHCGLFPGWPSLYSPVPHIPFVFKEKLYINCCVTGTYQQPPPHSHLHSLHCSVHQDLSQNQLCCSC